MERYIVVDLETTGHSPKAGDKIIEIGIVVIEENEITETFSSFIQPGRVIPSFITKLTNITNDDVQQAPTFKEIEKEIKSFFHEGIFIAHNVKFDFEFLNAELVMNGNERLKNAVIDTVELARILYPMAPGFKLGQLAEYVHLEHQNPHRALSDAYVTAKLFLLMKKKLNQLPVETINNLLKLEPFLRSDLFGLLQKQKQVLRQNPRKSEGITSFHGLAFREVEEIKTNSTSNISSYGDFLDNIYEQGGHLEKTLPKYEKRIGQRQMSEIIYDAFKEHKHALIEAGTGTGKSLAYLLPAIYEAVVQEERIVVSTFTTQLQAQLMEEDIPLVMKLIPFPFQVALLKGKQHYISLEKFENELEDVEGNHYGEILTKAMILVWLTETKTGDIDEIQLPSSGYSFYRKISTEAEGTIDPTSPWFRISYYQKAKEKARIADLIITNHALLCTDLFHDTKHLPSYQKAVIDEAHHLEETASRHYGLQLDYMHTVFLLNQIGTSDGKKWLSKVLMENPIFTQRVSIQKWDSLFIQVKSDLDELFRYIYQYVLDKNKYNKTLSDIGRLQFELVEEKWESNHWDFLKEMVARITMSITEMTFLFEQMLLNSYGDSHLHDKIKQYQERIENIKDKLTRLFLIEDSTQFKWIEIETFGAKNAVYVFSEPKEIASALQERLFNKKASIIMTSATLTTKNSFSFMEKRLGLKEEHTLKNQIASPFDYRSQVQLLIPNDFPDIRQQNQDEFLYATCEAILSLADITRGRMLVLFTSYDMLRKSYYLLKEMMAEEYILIAQGITSGSRMRLKKKFQTFEKAILLGTNSFWEGIDIPGESLSSLVIVRLPFQPPNHPVYKAKTELLESNGKNPFFHFALPHAIIRFKQGFGRLIRSKEDRGIIFVCDARLRKSRYGSQFINSIPNVPIHFDTTNHLMRFAKNWFQK